MTREQYIAQIKECYSGSECYQVCKEYIESLEAQMKAKDNENEKLIHEIIVLDNDLDRLISLERRKARSIVAMLFWEARKTLTAYRSQEHCDALYNYYYGQKTQFIDAYRLLKEK